MWTLQMIIVMKFLAELENFELPALPCPGWKVQLEVIFDGILRTRTDQDDRIHLYVSGFHAFGAGICRPHRWHRKYCPIDQGNFGASWTGSLFTVTFLFLARCNTGPFNNGDAVFPRSALWDPVSSRSAQALLAFVSSQFALLEPQPMGFTLGLVWPLAFWWSGWIEPDWKGFEFVWKKFWMSGSRDHFTHPLSASDQTHQTLPPPVKIVANVRLHRSSLRYHFIATAVVWIGFLICCFANLLRLSFIYEVLIWPSRSFSAHAFVGSATSLCPLVVCTCCGKQLRPFSCVNPRCPMLGTALFDTLAEADLGETCL